MAITGKRIKLTKWIHGTQCVVRVEVEGIVLESDPADPSLEPDTVRWLDELQRLADAGDVAALSKAGVVYVRKSA